MQTLLIATRNRHKVQEIQAILGEGFRCLTLNDFPAAPNVVEDASTFAGNATKKAAELAEWLAAEADDEYRNTVTFVLADDSGLEVDALNGAPGVYSARFAAVDGAGDRNSSDADNNVKLLRLLKEVPKERRTARFHCVIALVPVDWSRVAVASPVCYAGQAEFAAELFDGRCEGHVGFTAKGQGGFGYDPLFIPDGHIQSFAELDAAVKNQMSHRARALAKLRARLRPRG